MSKQKSWKRQASEVCTYSHKNPTRHTQANPTRYTWWNGKSLDDVQASDLHQTSHEHLQWMVQVDRILRVTDAVHCYQSNLFQWSLSSVVWSHLNKWPLYIFSLFSLDEVITCGKWSSIQWLLAHSLKNFVPKDAERHWDVNLILFPSRNDKWLTVNRFDCNNANVIFWGWGTSRRYALPFRQNLKGKNKQTALMVMCIRFSTAIEKVSVWSTHTHTHTKSHRRHLPQHRLVFK